MWFYPSVVFWIKEPSLQITWCQHFILKWQYNREREKAVSNRLRSEGGTLRLWLTLLLSLMFFLCLYLNLALKSLNSILSIFSQPKWENRCFELWNTFKDSICSKEERNSKVASSAVKSQYIFFDLEVVQTINNTSGVCLINDSEYFEIPNTWSIFVVSCGECLKLMMIVLLKMSQECQKILQFPRLYQNQRMHFYWTQGLGLLLVLVLNAWSSCISQHGEKSLLCMTAHMQSHICHRRRGLTTFVDVFHYDFILCSVADWFSPQRENDCLVCPVCMIVDNDRHFIRPLKIGASESNVIRAGLVNMITGEDKTVFLESDTENKECFFI